MASRVAPLLRECRPDLGQLAIEVSSFLKDRLRVDLCYGHMITIVLIMLVGALGVIDAAVVVLASVTVNVSGLANLYRLNFQGNSEFLGRLRLVDKAFWMLFVELNAGG